MGIADGTVASGVKITEDQALYLQYYGKMGKTGYTNLRLAMLPHGVVFPTYNEISVYKYKYIVPKELVWHIFSFLITILSVLHLLTFLFLF